MDIAEISLHADSRFDSIVVAIKQGDPLMINAKRNGKS